MGGRRGTRRRDSDARPADGSDRDARDRARLADRLRRRDRGRARPVRLALALTIGAAAGVAAATQSLSDTDLWWHLATGRETLAHGFVRTDLFSWTVRGAPVSTDQWLGPVLL